MHSDDFRNDQPALGELAGSGIMGQAQLSPRWRSDEGLSPAINTEKEFNKFQIRANEPTARAAEQKVFNDYRSQGLYPWNLTSRPELDWSEGKQDILGWQVRPGNIERINPVTNAGITNPNLNGYKVWNAGSFGDPSSWDWPSKLWGNKEENEQLQNQLNEIYRQQDKIRMGPYFFNPGPWNEFDPSRKEKEYYDMIDPDKEIEGWTPSDEYLSGETEAAQSKWRQQDNMEITIDDLIQRPEFEGWTRDEIKGWLYGQARASRGGIIGLL